MTLPQDFIEQMTGLLGVDEFREFEQSLSSPCPTSIRMNDDEECVDEVEGCVPWCKNGRYLKQRPLFTMDPLLHAGAYYVQEASSMFVAHLINIYIDKAGTALDLCAAPGGKTTLLLSALPEGSLLVANEVNHKRSNILAENVSKWQRSRDANCIVTNNEAKDFRKLGDEVFDLILCDVPCSGEGMFRKDERAIEEWSLQNVDMCWRRQRDIVSNIWDSLKEEGIMIYSTCTYNTKEDEENVLWIRDELGAEILDCHILPEWNITGCLLKGEGFPCCHFMPHKVKGEGFFCALLRKTSESGIEKNANQKKLVADIQKKLHVIPLDKICSDAPHVELQYDDAIRYLQGEALCLAPDTPKGLVVLTYLSHPLGMAKNIGTRANNLYPKEWRIRCKA